MLISRFPTSQCQCPIGLITHFYDVFCRGQALEPFYYWLIHAIHTQGHTEIARSELLTAKNHLLEEDYELLANRLAVEANMT